MGDSFIFWASHFFCKSPVTDHVWRKKTSHSPPPRGKIWIASHFPYKITGKSKKRSAPSTPVFFAHFTRHSSSTPACGLDPAKNKTGSQTRWTKGVKSPHPEGVPGLPPTFQFSPFALCFRIVFPPIFGQDLFPLRFELTDAQMT